MTRAATLADATACPLCESRPIEDGPLCNQCASDLAAQLQRRKAAAVRLCPLADVVA